MEKIGEDKEGEDEEERGRKDLAIENMMMRTENGIQMLK